MLKLIGYIKYIIIGVIVLGAMGLWTTSNKEVRRLEREVKELEHQAARLEKEGDKAYEKAEGYRVQFEEAAGMAKTVTVIKRVPAARREIQDFRLDLQACMAQNADLLTQNDASIRAIDFARLSISEYQTVAMFKDTEISTLEDIIDKQKKMVFELKKKSGRLGFGLFAGVMPDWPPRVTVGVGVYYKLFRLK